MSPMSLSCVRKGYLEEGKNTLIGTTDHLGGNPRGRATPPSQLRTEIFIVNVTNQPDHNT